MISRAQYELMQARTGAGGKASSTPSAEPPKEEHLHFQIIQYCNSQWPRWKFIRARMDMISTIACGCQDFTIFLPGGKILCVECKRKGGKLSVAQLAWANEMSKVGQTVFVITTINEFMDVVKGVGA
jgi:hypothetical protein